MFLFSPLSGILADLAGLGTVFVTKYPAVGAVTIPVLYLFPIFLKDGLEPGLVSLAGTALMFLLHRDSLKRISMGTEKKVCLQAKQKR
jgi:glycerol-3-phosphate acyltransferase PlsY